MQVKVRDGLTAILTMVGKEPVSCSIQIYIARNAVGYGDELTEQGIVLPTQGRNT